MADISSLLLSLSGGGLMTALVTAGRWVGDERARRQADKKAAALAPQEAKSFDLRIVERAGRIAETAGEIQHQTMEDLRRAYSELEARFEKYRKNAEEQREKDLREADRMRDHDRKELVDAREEIKRLKERIQDQDATVAQLQFELLQARHGP